MAGSARIWGPLILVLWFLGACGDGAAVDAEGGARADSVNAAIERTLSEPALDIEVASTVEGAAETASRLELQRPDRIRLISDSGLEMIQIGSDAYVRALPTREFVRTDTPTRSLAETFRVTLEALTAKNSRVDGRTIELVQDDVVTTAKIGSTGIEKIEMKSARMTIVYTITVPAVITPIVAPETVSGTSATSGCETLTIGGDEAQFCQ